LAADTPVKANKVKNNQESFMGVRLSSLIAGMDVGGIRRR
jgi:hypothetical protein